MITIPTDKLQKVLLGGGCEQGNLPIGYTRVEYLESSGTQYIDTGVVVNTLINPRIVTTFKMVSTADIDWWGTNNTYANTILWNLNNSASYMAGYVRWGSISTRQLTNQSQSDIASFNFTDFHTLDIGGVDIKQEIPIKIDGVLVNTLVAKGDADLSDTGTILIFRGRSIGIGQFKDFAIYSNNILILKLIPCRRKSDNVLGMYDTVTGNFLTNAGTGDFTAGADVTAPSPDTPMDIVCNNGVVKVSRNLLNNPVYTKGYVESNGELKTSDGTILNFYPVSPNTTYTFTYTKGTNNNYYDRICGYSSNNVSTFTELLVQKDFRSYSIGDRLSSTFTTGANTNYIAIGILCGNAVGIIPTDPQLEQGSISTPYMPYGEIYTDGTQETVTVTGKNLFDGQWQVGIYNTSTGIYNSSATNRICNVDMILIKPLTDYTVSCPSYVLANRIKWLFYDKNKNFISAIVTGATTITTPSNAKYINFYIANDLTVATAPQCQIELGSTATTYEPYFNGGTANAEMLLSIGDYKDTQEVLGGNVTRNVGIKVLDGSETWKKYSGNTWTFLTPLSNYNKGQLNRPVISTHFKKMNGWDFQNGIYIGNNMVDGIHIGADGYFSNVDDFKAWLADQYANGTPVIIVYPLATATTESVTPQLLSGSVVTQTAGSIPDMDIDLIKRPAELINRFITDSNGVPHKVISTFVGNKMIYNTEPVIYNDTNAEFYKRQTANGAIEDTDKLKCAIKEVRGKSIVWNQIIGNNDFTNSENVAFWVSSKFTKSFNNNSMELSYDGDVSSGSIMRRSQNAVVGHKYLALYMIKASTPTTCGTGYGGNYKTLVWKVGTSWDVYGYILTAKSTDNYVYAYAQLGSGNKVNIRYVNMFDLTLMFGAGNEPATVAEFEKMFPLDYYDYNAGEVIPFAGQNLVTTGFNQWDEQWEVGEYTTTSGKPIGNFGVRSKNFIKVLPNQTYYFHCDKRGTNDKYAVFFYNANLEILSISSFDHIFSVSQFTTPSNCNYIHFHVPNSWYGSIYNNDICINISDEDKNGTYEPYEKHILPLDPSQWRDKQGNLVFPYGGMHGVGTAYDYAKVDADGYIRKAVRCFEQVNLGSLSWSAPTIVVNYPVSNTSSIKNVKKGTSGLISAKYIKGGFGQDKAIQVHSTYTTVYVSDSDIDGMTSSEVKAYMTGEMLIYELAEPVEVELATPVYAKYLVDKDGTEEISPENGSTPYTTMATMNLIYSERKNQ